MTDSLSLRPGLSEPAVVRFQKEIDRLREYIHWWLRSLHVTAAVIRSLDHLVPAAVTRDRHIRQWCLLAKHFGRVFRYDHLLSAENTLPDIPVPSDLFGRSLSAEG